MIEEYIKEELPPLFPLHFFHILADCRYRAPSEPTKTLFTEEFQLPDTTSISGEEQFADLFTSWNHEGMDFGAVVQSSPLLSRFPDLELGDSLELFIDTRNVKNSGFNTRFCHHFFFLAQMLEGRAAGELTHFRTEDRHDFCNPNELKRDVESIEKGYRMHIHIPAHCLHGFNPEESACIGFSYTVNRFDGEAQNFSASRLEYRIEQQPSLWGTLRLLA